MVTPEAHTGAPGDSTWCIDRYWGGGLQAWGVVEQDPTGEWWVTVAGAAGSTTGPYLDEVQALRALQAWNGEQ